MMSLFDEIRYPMNDFTEEELQEIENKYPGEEGKKRVQELRELTAQVNGGLDDECAYPEAEESNLTVRIGGGMRAKKGGPTMIIEGLFDNIGKKPLEPLTEEQRKKREEFARQMENMTREERLRRMHECVDRQKAEFFNVQTEVCVDSPEDTEDK